MKKVNPIDPDDPDRSVLFAAAALIRKGGVVAIPTDTFYGLAADPFNLKVVRRLFEIKGRDSSKPILLLISGLQMLPSLVEEVSPLAEKLIGRFWPGPLTLIFKASKQLPDLLTGGTGTIGVRFPNAPLPIRLIDQVGFPITATSANRSGAPSPASAQEVERGLGAAVDCILDGGVCSTLPSTVLDVTASEPHLLREGRVSADQVAAAIKKG
ncbi:MAG: threonylcarbamoyl-AMP synthase [Candidatus Manganitrophaceae bacterium]|nr:MAG: threonylcarbamoyl-AMP synthase [Candidatus Manganitrophaceae bacterium]